ncbi:hypothetical protein HDU97_009374 [Phlyctochytrium planicorne]|nr:hypothetical protein HDU97_009374 [Phlyctochytrium planicorne]
MPLNALIHPLNEVRDLFFSSGVAALKLALNVSIHSWYRLTFFPTEFAISLAPCRSKKITSSRSKVTETSSKTVSISIQTVKARPDPTEDLMQKILQALYVQMAQNTSKKQEGGEDKKAEDEDENDDENEEDEEEEE